MLLERPGELVTREELHQRLWPNGTIVEFDHNINAVIKRLRAKHWRIRLRTPHSSKLCLGEATGFSFP